MNSVTIRNIPPQLLERLKQRAKNERRSLNSEIIRILENAESSPNEKSILDIIDEMGKDNVFSENVEKAYENRSYGRNSIGNPKK